MFVVLSLSFSLILACFLSLSFSLSFVMVNSVAMEGDGCNICSEEEAELRKISRRLNCSLKVGTDLHVQAHVFWYLPKAPRVHNLFFG